MTKALDEQCILQFDEVVKWEVKDTCFWLEAVRSVEMSLTVLQICA